ncbi:MAG TPA: hypothetical protein VEG61_09125 [Candidatus Dormibacteraeota bacterium]|nr:hypothetical protein [Candidatus Dormibacteraeota bacterium]
MPMLPSPTLAILTVLLIAGLLIGWAWSKRLRHEEPETQFELEKLTNCRSCGSLIPEGVRRCAFCGAWQGDRHPENK